MKRSLSLAALGIALFLTPRLEAGDESFQTGVETRSRVPRLGARVRVKAPMVTEGRLVGTLVEFGDKAFIVSDASGVVEVPYDAVTSIEVSGGKHRQWKRGAIAGTALMAPWAASIHKPAPRQPDDFVYFGCGWSCDPNPGQARGVILATGFALGIGSGALHQKEKWIPISIDEIRPALDPVPMAPVVPTNAPQAEKAPHSPPSGSSPNEGARLRSTRRLTSRLLLNNGEKIRGALESITPDEVMLLSLAGTEVIARADIRRIEVSAGLKRQWLKGLLIGTVVAAVADFTNTPECTDTGGLFATKPCSRAQSVSDSAIGGALTGAMIGAFVKRDSWRPYHGRESRSESSARVSDTLVRFTPIVNVGERKAGLSLSLAW